MIIGAVIGMNDDTRASVPSGFCRTPNEMKNDTRMTMVRGAVEDCSSSWRGTIAPAQANAPA